MVIANALGEPSTTVLRRMRFPQSGHSQPSTSLPAYDFGVFAKISLAFARDPITSHAPTPCGGQARHCGGRTVSAASCPFTSVSYENSVTTSLPSAFTKHTLSSRKAVIFPDLMPKGVLKLT